MNSDTLNKDKQLRRRIKSRMSEEKRQLLIVEDDTGLQKQLKWFFSEHYNVMVVDSHDAALAEMRCNGAEVVLLDLGLPPHPDDSTEGLRVLADISRIAPCTRTIVLTGFGDTETAVKAVSKGAWDFFPKPAEPQVLGVMVDRAFRMSTLERLYREQEQRPMATDTFGLITANATMQQLWKKARKIALTDITCLIRGESGTGKEVIARAIHQVSKRHKWPFVAINCAAIPEALIESELFGFERGAFTGAYKQTPGKIEVANHGTLFLDELGDMPLPAQAKLLRFMQERKIERIGGRTEIPVDVRVLCATNKSLLEMVKEGTFREDLYFRMAETELVVPPLRDRGQDKLFLARTFLSRFAEEYGSDVVNFDEGALSAIENYAWPGNVRELMSKVKHGVVMADRKFVTSADLGFKLVEPFPNLRQARERGERVAIMKALTASSGKIAAASRLLGVTRPTMYDLMKRYGIGDTTARGLDDLHPVDDDKSLPRSAAPQSP